ncbi:NADPH-dependent FMN reductase [Sphingobium boeckii]|uniref:NAD(P)H-dependent FMN reductase n=1 Tax=Sphingobium boeckii TaxID=1082345 RepID=A0A7W9AFL0_9SPHN|nr:NADPH-dependent FMN reductase [Sphingobium boeckii]MBB5684549.1 NAD(P)H-dependent FMN reductase [Sphingobium boeckii]
MALNIPVIYGSYRTGRMGIRLADFIVSRLNTRGEKAELIDARAIGLPMLDKRYADHPAGEAPEAMERLAETLRNADAFVFVAGEYNQGVQPGLKNLVDHYLQEFAYRPAAIACYSAGVFAGVRSMASWRVTLAALGMPTIGEILPLGQIGHALDERGEPTGDGGARLEKNFPKFAGELRWWAEAAKAQRAAQTPPV